MKNNRECPICHEKVHELAKICIHCKEPINEWVYPLKPFLMSHGALEKHFKGTAEYYFIHLLRLEITLSVGILIAFKLFERNGNIIYAFNEPIMLIIILLLTSMFLAYAAIILLCIEYRNDGDNEARYIKNLKTMRFKGEGKEIDAEIGRITKSEYNSGKAFEWRSEPMVFGVIAIIFFLIAIFLLPLTLKEAKPHVQAIEPIIGFVNHVLVRFVTYIFPIVFSYMFAKFKKLDIIVWTRSDVIMMFIFFTIAALIEQLLFFPDMLRMFLCFIIFGIFSSIHLYLKNK